MGMEDVLRIDKILDFCDAAVHTDTVQPAGLYFFHGFYQFFQRSGKAEGEKSVNDEKAEKGKKKH